MHTRHANHDRAFRGNHLIRIVARLIDIGLEDVIEHLSKLCTGDVILRTERTVWIAVYISLGHKTDDAIFRPGADIGSIRETCQSLVIGVRDAQNSGKNKKHLFSGYVSVRIKGRIARTRQGAHLVSLGDRLVKPICFRNVGQHGDICFPGRAKGTRDKGS